LPERLKTTIPVSQSERKPEFRDGEQSWKPIWGGSGEKAEVERWRCVGENKAAIDKMKNLKSSCPSAMHFEQSLLL
jgi:hypothetical protein